MQPTIIAGLGLLAERRYNNRVGTLHDTITIRLQLQQLLVYIELWHILNKSAASDGVSKRHYFKLAIIVDHFFCKTRII